MAKRKRNQTRGPGRPTKQESLEKALDRGEVEKQNVQIAAAVFLLFNDDKLIDQYELRRWVAAKAGLDLALVMKATTPQVVPFDQAEEPDTLGAGDPTPETGDPEPDQTPAPTEPAPEPEPAPA